MDVEEINKKIQSHEKAITELEQQKDQILRESKRKEYASLIENLKKIVLQNIDSNIDSIIDFFYLKDKNRKNSIIIWDAGISETCKIAEITLGMLQNVSAEKES